MKRLISLALWIGLALGLLAGSAVAQDCSGTPAANTLCAGPTSGGGGFPSFRAMVPADIPASIFANPTAVIGLTAVNGSAATGIRTDGAPALSQAIIPTWTGIHTHANTVIFAPPAGLTQGFQGTQSLSGSSTVNLKFNQFIIPSDVTNISTGVVTSLSGTGYWFEHDFGGGAMQGGRQVMLISGNLTAPSNSSNLNHNYAALTASMQCQTGDNGTDTGANAKGACFGTNDVVDTLSGTLNLLEITGGEANVSLRTGATAKYKFGWSVVATANDKVSAVSDDAGYQLGAQTGAIGFNFGWYASLANGIFPVKSTGTLFGSAAGTVAHGIDLTSLTCLTDCLAVPGGTSSPTGQLKFLEFVPTGNGSFAVSTAKVYKDASHGLVVAAGAGSTYDIEFVGRGGNELFANIQSSNDLRLVGDPAAAANQGHLRTGQYPPGLTGCGTGSPTITGSDTVGVVTMGTNATGCVLTFAVAYVSAPTCIVTWQATPLASQSYTVTNTALTLVQTSTSGNKANYNCWAQTGG